MQLSVAVVYAKLYGVIYRQLISVKRCSIVTDLMTVSGLSNVSLEQNSDFSVNNF